MKKELKVLGSINEHGLFEPTHFKVSKEVCDHDNNSHLNLKPGSYSEITLKGPCQCPPDTGNGYYVCSAGQCVFVPFG